MGDADEKVTWERALQALLLGHLPFHPSETEDFKELTREFSALEQIFLENEKLRGYYAACMNIECPNAPVPLDPCDTINVAAMQIQLMEDAFFSLRLYHYANAPDNRGWMNLFRSWGRYQRFRDHFKALSPHYSARFVRFYYDYIQDWGPIDEEPVPHFWDVAASLPAIEMPLEKDLLPEELKRREEERRLTKEEIMASKYGGVTAQSVTKVKERSTATHEVKGMCLDRGRREAGSPLGRPTGTRREVPTPIEGEHSEEPRKPPGDPK